MLDATMDFVVDEILNTLTLTVTNTTVDPDLFQINRIYFNAPSGGIKRKVSVSCQ